MRTAVRSLAAFVGAVVLVVGAAGPAAAAPRPFRAVDFGSLSTHAASSAVAINDRGAVVGTARASDGSTHGVLWRADGTLRDLGRDVYPADINNHGTIVGTAGVGANGSSRAPAPSRRSLPTWIPPSFPSS